MVQKVNHAPSRSDDTLGSCRPRIKGRTSVQVVTCIYRVTFQTRPCVFSTQLVNFRSHFSDDGQDNRSLCAYAYCTNMAAEFALA